MPKVIRFKVRDVQHMVLHAGHCFMILKRRGVDLVHITRPGEDRAICHSHIWAGVVIDQADLSFNLDRLVCHHCLVALQSARERKIMDAMKLAK